MSRYPTFSFLLILGAFILAVVLFMRTALQWDRDHPCIRWEPGTCWTRHVPLHSGPYPCNVCVERAGGSR